MFSPLNTLRPWLTFSLLCALSLLGAMWLQSGTDARPFAVLSDLFNDLRSKLVNVVQIGPDTAAESATVSPAKDWTYSYDPMTIAKASRPGLISDHTANDHQVCSRPPTKSRSDTEARLVYKWIDESGQTHLSDQRPSGQIASIMDLAGNKRDFTYEIIPDGVTLPIDFQGKVRAGAKRIYDTWNFFLREENLRQSQITLRVIGGSDRFDAIRAKVWPNSKPVSGFYNPGLNQAFVKYNPARPDQALATSFHEISHLITASLSLPKTPCLISFLLHLTKKVALDKRPIFRWTHQSPWQRKFP